MAVTISVYRGAGARDGGEISEPMLGTSLPAALARGRAELDAAAHPRRALTLDVIYRPQSRLGELIEIDDPIHGVPWRGKITGIVHRDDGASIVTTLSVERPL